MRRVPVAIIELLIRFFGAGARRDFGEILGVFVRRPYEDVIDDLRRRVTGDIEDITDPNDETSFGYTFDRYVLRLSMVGPFAVLLRREDDTNWWCPVNSAEGDFERDLVECVSSHGFVLMNTRDLEAQADVWGDEPPIALYRLLFVSEGELPWRSAAQ